MDQTRSHASCSETANRSRMPKQNEFVSIQTAPAGKQVNCLQVLGELAIQ